MASISDLSSGGGGGGGGGCVLFKFKHGGVDVNDDDMYGDLLW